MRPRRWGRDSGFCSQLLIRARTTLTGSRLRTGLHIILDAQPSPEDGEGHARRSVVCTHASCAEEAAELRERSGFSGRRLDTCMHACMAPPACVHATSASDPLHVPTCITQLAAMALSPLAALSLPLVNNEGWLESMREFADQLRRKVRVGIDQDSFKQQVKQLDNNMTFMDWTYKMTGVDLTYVWDPELWVKFKEAVWLDQPNIFWNELMDRVEYSECQRPGLLREGRLGGQPSWPLSNGTKAGVATRNECEWGSSHTRHHTHTLPP